MFSFGADVAGEVVKRMNYVVDVMLRANNFAKLLVPLPRPVKAAACSSYFQPRAMFACPAKRGSANLPLSNRREKNSLAKRQKPP